MLASMIRPFKCKDTWALYETGKSVRWRACLRVAERRLNSLDQAADLRDLANIPGNRLEVLKGDRKGGHSIRVNDQWRICFIWRAPDAYEVEIVDYH